MPLSIELIKDHPQTLFSFSSPGNTPLHLAVMMGHKGEKCQQSHLQVVYFLSLSLCVYLSVSVAFQMNLSAGLHVLCLCFRLSVRFCVCVSALFCRLCECICLAQNHQTFFGHRSSPTQILARCSCVFKGFLFMDFCLDWIEQCLLSYLIHSQRLL